MLKKIILIFAPFFLMASWEEVAVKGLDVMISANVGDSENFKKSLNSLIERAAREYAKSGITQYELDLPNFIAKKTSPNSPTARTMRRSLTQSLTPAIPNLKQILQSKISAMDENSTQAIMRGELSLAHYMRVNAFNEIYAALRPNIENLASDTSFAKSYKNATGSEIGDDFANEFTSEFLNDAFDKLVAHEREFRNSTEAMFNILKTIR
ncbi:MULTISPECIES: DUF4197 family protein [unclassified Campylobacter]|uniref:DUF4197 family protein n=1 Tax=unclassified Campylobacter TaxID=2593542 RepID=UPI0022E9D6A0|nr:MULTISPECIES: DUF4197 family protein [unclassified Campylobacter]MDA3074146.1 DUF4197 family protein [Campylobacter sp. JMF_10 EL2]